MKHIFYLLLVFLCIGCKNETLSEVYTNESEYLPFLNTSERPTYTSVWEQKDFWSKRLNEDTTGVGDIGNLAAAYESLFGQTGKIQYLKDAEKLYLKGIEHAANQFRDSFERSLARNYITQHRFKEADSLLKKSIEGVSNKRATKMMLFDTAMELGNYDAAYEYLSDIKQLNDFNYLIRVSKWSDYKGDLDNAIKYLEKAKDLAHSIDNKALQVWTYSNLADYYGHAGRITDSYEHYLKTLQLQPDNHYAKKGIAWVAYSAEGNTTKAHTILDSVMKVHEVPDYYLLKSELYAFEGNDTQANVMQQKFIETIRLGNYGTMYNTYLIELFVEEQPKEALILALEEVIHRATPETYQLLAFAQLKNNDKSLALETIENHVKGKTHEPMAQYYSALVYKANGMKKEVSTIKKELLDAAYEIGPLLTQEVESW